MGGRRLHKAGLLLAGTITGLLGFAIGLWFYVQAGQVTEVRTALGDRLRVAREAIGRVQFVEERAIRFDLRDVALLDEAGDTVLASPRLTMTLDTRTLEGDGAIEFHDVEVLEPFARLILSPTGEWNYERPLRLTARGQPVETEPGRPILLRDVRLMDGRLVLAFPTEIDPAPAGFAMNLPITQLAGEPYQVYRVTDVQGRLPRVRLGGPTGWRAEVASLTGLVEEPNLRIDHLAGWAEQDGADAVHFEVAALRFGDSALEAGGRIRFAEAGIFYDVDLRAAPLWLADLRPIFPDLPAEGMARFDLAVESRTVERLALGFTNLDVTGLDSRILGSVAFAVGGPQPLALMDADLELAPLQLLALEQLGFVDDLPVVGTLTGRVTSRGAAAGVALVDLTARIAPRDRPEATPSVVLASGSIELGDADDPLRLDGLTVGFQPLYVDALGALLPGQADRLRGLLRGSVNLAGTFADLRFAGGDLTYLIGDAPPTRLTGLDGRIVTQPALAFEIRAQAEPLALATLTELFPGLPFRAATLTGPIEITGDAERLQMTADLAGPAGGIRFTAATTLGERPTFDVRGSLSAFVTGIILRPDVPVEGPLTGTFAVHGTTDQFTFDVDLTQREGRFALRGTVTPAVEPARFQMAGEIWDFRIGSLLGDPQLFPDPMTGTISLAGGGNEPYTFDVDLRGEIGRLDLAGFYRPGVIPSYSVQGFVAGLDLSRLPTGPPLPPTALTGTVQIDGRGLDAETLEGTFAFRATESTVGGLPLDVGVARVEVRGGVMHVDTLHFRYERTELLASGAWGLRTPTTDPLRFSLVSPDLSVLNRVIGPGEVFPVRISGTVRAEGEVAGSFQNPIIAVRGEGRNLQYEEWRADRLTVDVDAARDPVTGWAGDLTILGDNLFLPQLDRVESLRLQATGAAGDFGVGLYARRGAASDLELTGSLELEGLVPQGLALETMILRLEGVVWELLGPARVRFVRTDGLFVEDLALERRGPEPGLISVHGSIPPTGVADLSVAITNLDLSDLRRITTAVPPLEGLLTMEAVLSGPVADPEMSIQARLDDLRYEGVLTDRITFDGFYSDQRMIGFAEVATEGVSLFRADLSLPMLLSLEGLIPSVEMLTTAPASMTLVADSLPLDLVAAMVPGLRDGVGAVRADIVMEGTLDVPALQGSVVLAGGAVTIEPLGVRYSAIDAEVVLSQNRAVINRFSARSDGSMTASGSIDFPPNSPPRLALSVGLDQFRVIDDPATARVLASGQLSLTGPTTAPVLTGQVAIRESTLRVPDFAAEEPGLELGYLDVAFDPLLGLEAPVPPAPLFGNIQMDGVQVSIAESVWLESNELRVQINGDLVLFRVADDLRIFGALQAVRGTYALELSAIVREFDIIRGRVQFFGTGDLNPSLDILAGHRVRATAVGRGGDLTILVHLTGTLLAPRVQLTSDTPVPLSETDLISYLLFGQPSFELGGVTRTFAEQLFLQEVVGGLIATELERPILRAGLCDWVRLRPGLTTTFRGLLGAGPLAGAMIECGWELTTNFFLTGQTGIGGLFGGEFTDWRLGVEWQIDDQWLWEASYGAVRRDPFLRVFDPRTRLQFSTDLRRQWEYGLPTRRAPIDLAPEPILNSNGGPDTRSEEPAVDGVAGQGTGE
jgi:hypothetical protein